jgi:hypothetical protein
MIRSSARQGRALFAFVAALAIAVAACSSSSSSSSIPFGGGGNGGGSDGGNGGGNGGTSLTAGLSANLDKLTSYKFTWTVFGSSSGSGASPGDSGSYATTGMVVNTPTKSYTVNAFGVQYIVIGDQAWTSTDGATWNSIDASTITVSDFLPTQDYAQWFDVNADQFTSAGEETKNGVQCIHYKGNSSLSNLYQGLGVSANFQADLWVAKDGNYPVSGVYGFSGSAGGQSGSFGYQFDITNINDPANVITAPTTAAEPS